jgi:Flp pilus assembly protein TadG
MNMAKNHTRHGERGQALLEVALTLPLLLLVSIGIFEFGRAFQTWQVVTNAAREGARIAVLPGATSASVQTRVREYLKSGQLSRYNTAAVSVNPTSQISIGAGTASASVVTVTYPFDFVVLNPVAKLVTNTSNTGKSPISLTTSAAMRNESQF